MVVKPICKGCGQPICGTYVTALGATWHVEHLRCEICGQPIGNEGFYECQGRPLHPRCYCLHVAAHCAYCGRPLTSQYLVDYWGTKFCPEHQGQYPACRFCGRLVPPRHQASEAGRKEGTCCPICRARAIDSIAQARPIFARLVKWVNDQGLMYNGLQLRIELRNRAQLAQILRQAEDTRTMGATLSVARIENDRIVSRTILGVAILRGLPFTLFQGVTVHELGHAWLAVHGVETLQGWAEEGFCEFLAHRYYTELPNAESHYHAMSIEQSPDPVYGDGFRSLRSCAETIGFQRLLETLCVAKRLPVL